MSSTMHVWTTADQRATILIKTQMDKSQIEMWTTNRLPYEPKGALLKARDYLREQIKKLNASPQEIIEAKYVSSLNDFVDTENVLFYNVGTPAFANSSVFGLKFVRMIAGPPLAPDSHTQWQHYHTYSLADRGDQRITGSTSAVRLTFNLPRISAQFKPHTYWWAAKRGALENRGNCDLADKPFYMKVSLTGPPVQSYSAAIVKPLFDGIISALHCDPTIMSQGEVCLRLAEVLKTDANMIASLLRDEDDCVFGMRCPLVRPTEKFVAWNPADELCHVGELLFDLQPSSIWTVRVEITDLK